MASRKGSLDDTAQLLNSAAIHLLRGMRAVDRLAGLTPARLSALSVLVFGGPCTLGALARTEGVAAPTMTGVVRGLVELGLATSETHPDSGRQVLVSATPAGEELMHEAAARRRAVIVEALRALPVEERRAVVGAAPALRDLSRTVPDAARRRAQSVK